MRYAANLFSQPFITCALIHKVMKLKKNWLLVMISAGFCVISIFAFSINQASRPVLSKDWRRSTAIAPEQAEKALEDSLQRGGKTVDRGENLDVGQIKSKFAENYRSVLDSTDPEAVKYESLRILAAKFVQTVGLEVALNQASEMLGPGRFRNVLYADLFEFSSDSHLLKLSIARKMSAAEDGDWAISGVFRGAVKNGIDDSMLSALFPLKTHEIDAFHAFVRELVEQGNGGNFFSVRNGLDLIARAHPDGGAFDNASQAFLERMSLSRPLEVWEVCKSPDSTMISDEYKGILGSRCLRSIVAGSAEVGMTEALDFEESFPGVLPKGVFGQLMKNYIKNDAGGALKWYDEHKSSLNQVELDHIEVAFAENSISSSNISEANRWAALISEENLKKTVDGKIWSSERDSLRKEVVANPVGTLQSIVSGQSKYSDYWIEEAMGTWVAKDFDKAQEWYQKNWNSMPANKSQYLAAAFANQATEQGDTATASQWAAHIQDAKTKQRIEAGIAKAEAAKSK